MPMKMHGVVALLARVEAELNFARSAFQGDLAVCLGRNMSVLM